MMSSNSKRSSKKISGKNKSNKSSSKKSALSLNTPEICLNQYNVDASEEQEILKNNEQPKFIENKKEIENCVEGLKKLNQTDEVKKIINSLQKVLKNQ